MGEVGKKPKSIEVPLWDSAKLDTEIMKET